MIGYAVCRIIKLPFGLHHKLPKSWGVYAVKSFGAGAHERADRLCGIMNGNSRFMHHYPVRIKAVLK